MQDRDPCCEPSLWVFEVRAAWIAGVSMGLARASDAQLEGHVDQLLYLEGQARGMRRSGQTNADLRVGDGGNRIIVGLCYVRPGKDLDSPGERQCQLTKAIYLNFIVIR